MNINSCEWVETPVELIVEIAKGVNDATESEYRAKTDWSSRVFSDSTTATAPPNSAAPNR